MAYQINNHLQLDGDTVDDDFTVNILRHPDIVKLQKKVKALEMMVSRLHSFITIIDENILLHTTNVDGEDIQKRY